MRVRGDLKFDGSKPLMRRIHYIIETMGPGFYQGPVRGRHYEV
jgi:hypothetical protein